MTWWIAERSSSREYGSGMWYISAERSRRARWSPRRKTAVPPSASYERMPSKTVVP